MATNGLKLNFMILSCAFFGAREASAEKLNCLGYMLSRRIVAIGIAVEIPE